MIVVQYYLETLQEKSRFTFQSRFSTDKGVKPSGNVEHLGHVQEVCNCRGGTIMLKGGIIIGNRSNFVFPNLV